DDVWAVGSRVIISGGFGIDQTLTEHWDGVQWSVVPSPNVGPNNNFLQDVAAVSSDDVWAAGIYSSMGLDEPLIVHWDGAQWSVVPSPSVGGASGNFLSGVASVSREEAWAAGDYEPCGSGCRRTLVLRYSDPCTSTTSTPSPTSTSVVTATPL